MAKKAIRAEQAIIVEVSERLAYLRSLRPALSRQAATKAMTKLAALIDEIEVLWSDLDPIKDPGYSFDPTNPDTAGRLVALALLAQEKVPLARIARTYGSGVYAIYYEGDHPAYSVVSKTETPVYVGKADPKQADARTSREQGPQLYGRLADHRRMIQTVSKYAITNKLPHSLLIDDFFCRRLVCVTNAQLGAERHLIGTFQPVWNSEVGICWGISKHGDSATTRANKRSPWDVLHPGRIWAMAAQLEDKISPKDILEKIRQHFTKNPPQHKRALIVRTLMKAFIQNAAAIDGQTLLDHHDEDIEEKPSESLVGSK